VHAYFGLATSVREKQHSKYRTRVVELGMGDNDEAATKGKKTEEQ
jgi:hypothetical protein